MRSNYQLNRVILKFLLKSTSLSPIQTQNLFKRLRLFRELDSGKIFHQFSAEIKIHKVVKCKKT